MRARPLQIAASRASLRLSLAQNVWQHSCSHQMTTLLFLIVWSTNSLTLISTSFFASLG